ncbi:MAG TPA: ATP-binding protein [Blastocatellia bacterium]|nr:ATP-binding protein [Blastocatellia bacterium]
MASILGANIVNFQVPDRALRSSSDRCQRCQDTGWERVIQGLHSSVRRCTARLHLRETLISANVPELYADSTIDDFAVPSGTIGLLERIKQFCSAYPKVNDGFFLTGGPNTGKTHLAVAVMFELLARGARRVKFHDTTELLRRLDPGSGVLDIRSRKELLAETQSAGLIVLDDFGAVTPTDSEIEQLDYLIDSHYRAMRPMIITSRRTSDDLSSIFGTRIISRMVSMATEIDLG